MKINCISCGHNISLDVAYDDFTGLVKCYVCGALLEITTAEGHLRSITLPAVPPPHKEPGPAVHGPNPGVAQALGA